MKLAHRLLWFLFGRVTCAWCRKDKKKPFIPVKRWSIVSHGICPACAWKFGASVLKP